MSFSSKIRLDMQTVKLFLYLGTIHKRRLLRGVGRWGPPKGDIM